VSGGLARFSPREGAANDAVAGVKPRLVFTPVNRDQAAALMAELSAAKQTVAFVGGATQLDLGHAPERLDAVVRTERLNKMIEYAPSDQIVIAEAGMTLAALQRELAVSGQRLAIDPPLAARATLGGIVASNAFGPLRTRYGSIRDLIIGISFVRADGVTARGGGKVVKNVAGFDLPKLLVGSLGTLGLITTVSLRLHPLPLTEVTVLLTQQTAPDVRALVVQMRAAQLEPAAVFAWNDGDALSVAVRFEGFPTGVEEQKSRLLALSSGKARCQALDQAAGRELTKRHDEVRTAGSIRAKFAALPASIESVMAEALRPLLDVFDRAGLVYYPMLGLGFVTGEPRSAERAAEAIATARRFLEQQGGSLVLEVAGAELRARSDVWGSAPGALSLMRSVKARFDPDRLLAPGRFAAGT
jgi:glycolate oxidase FAD binding subunit